ncbi:hypothetical protein [Gimesia chilikensis]|uniref:hypothetical protein n=1 Tax=Gimesia chilikensis TaxID=2605989 RepID=UPI003A95B9EF
MANPIVRFDLMFEDRYEDKVGPERNFTDIYSCTLASVDVDPILIRTHSKCPQLGDKHKRDLAARVVHRQFQRVDDTVDFNVTINYSTDIEQPDKEPNPLHRPAQIDISSSPEMVPTFFDGKGKPRLNTAGDLIVGYRRVPFLDITVQKNVADYPEWLWDFDGTVNRDPITLRKKEFDSRTLRIEGIDIPDKQFENGKWFYPLTFRIRHDPRTFDDIRYSMGLNELVRVDTGLKSIPNGINPGDVTIENSKVYRQVKRRITIGTPAEYPTEPEFLDKEGARIELIPDRKGRFDLDRLHLLKFSDDIQTDYSILPFK